MTLANMLCIYFCSFHFDLHYTTFILPSHIFYTQFYGLCIWDFVYATEKSAITTAWRSKDTSDNSWLQQQLMNHLVGEKP